MATKRIFYCSRCGDMCLLVLGQSAICQRCGQQVTPPAVYPSACVATDTNASFGLRSQGKPGIVVALLLYFFFPVGLYLLWTHPSWPHIQKWKYTIIWLSALLGLLLFSLTFSLVMAIGQF